MKKKIIDKLTNYICKYKESSDLDIKKYRYGLETIYNLITKSIVFLTITLFTRSFKECLLIIIFYTFLRLFAYGMHASTSLGCWLTTLPTYVGGSLFVKYMSLNKITIYIIWIIYLIFAFLWAPADTKKRPLIHADRRKKLKIESLIICLIYGLLIVFLNNQKILNAIGFCLTLQAICICPLTYFITGNRFNNYIYYNKEHGLN